MKSLFITGTDTDIGKTTVAVNLLKQLNQAGYRTFAIKPVASGSVHTNSGELVNSDALALQQAASIKRPYNEVNPYCFEPAIAPHIVASQAGVQLQSDLVAKHILQCIQVEADINIIEGVGGWSVPINENELMSDVIRALNIPVILVVGLKLRCLNHSIQTYYEIKRSCVPFIGWIANCIDHNMLERDENISTLKRFIVEPCLGIMPYSI